MQGITNIQTLTFHHILEGSLSDARVLAVVETWSELTSLSIEGGEGDIEFLKCVAEHCPALRQLQVGFFPETLPAIATTPTLSHALQRLTFFNPLSGEHRYGGERRWNSVDVHLLARHIDRMFPNVEAITGENWHTHRLKEVEKLVFMCQDVRRTAWEQK
ncbi:hypothetical protein C8R44DRAFT_806306 [Mycena epipterygia]|nr:hypothetical protein C8R44DRAFT_806306 [Mycena epipterygia]